MDRRRFLLTSLAVASPRRSPSRRSRRRRCSRWASFTPGPAPKSAWLRCARPGTSRARTWSSTPACRRPHRTPAGARSGAGRPEARRHSRDGLGRHPGGQERDEDHPHRHGVWRRSCWEGTRRQPGAPRWQRHRRQPRGGGHNGRQAGGDFQRGGAARAPYRPPKLAEDGGGASEGGRAGGARTLKTETVFVEVRNGDYEGAFSTLAAERADALFVLSNALLNRDRKRIIALAARNRMPAVYERRESAEDGGLLAYGAKSRDLNRRVAAYRRQDPQGRQAGGSARRAAHQVRARHQPQDRQGPRPHDPAVAAGAGGPGD